MNKGTQYHQQYMIQALIMAKKAFAIDEVPIGSVIVDVRGKIIGRGYNQVEKRKVQTAHAEVLAIEQACKRVGDWRLDECWLYVTLEPCSMCMGLIKLSRLAGVVFGAESKLFSYRLDRGRDIPLYNRDIIVIGGVEALESSHLLKSFFKQKREDR